MSLRNNMVQNQRACFILYVITIKCVCGKALKFPVCCKDKSSAQPKFQEVSPSQLQNQSNNKKCMKFSGVAKSWHPVAQGWHLPPHATPWLRACPCRGDTSTLSLGGVRACPATLHFPLRKLHLQHGNIFQIIPLWQ